MPTRRPSDREGTSPRSTSSAHNVDMGIERVSSPAASRFIENLRPNEREKVNASVATLEALISSGVDLTGIRIPLEGSHQALVAEIERVPPSYHRIHVELVPAAGLAEEQVKSPPRKMTREEAIRIVNAGIGTRPDLPTGVEYVRQVRGIWKGLMPRGRRSS